MESETNCLRVLHGLHTSFKGVRDQLDRGPKLIKARKQFALQKQAEVNAQQEKLTKFKLDVDRSSLQLKTNEAKIDGLRSKLNAANSNREFDIIKSQIEADTMANSVLEDEILNLLEKVDVAKVDLGRLEKEHADAKHEETRVAAEVSAAEADLKARMSQLEQEIAEAEKELPADVQGYYRRMVQAHGSDAFSLVEGNICTHCYVQLPPQTLVELKSGKILFCKTCGRVMYLELNA